MTTNKDIYIDKITDLLHKNKCAINDFDIKTKCTVSFDIKDNCKNDIYISIHGPDWKYVLIKLEEFFKI